MYRNKLKSVIMLLIILFSVSCKKDKERVPYEYLALLFYGQTPACSTSGAFHYYGANNQISEHYRSIDGSCWSKYTPSILVDYMDYGNGVFVAVHSYNSSFSNKISHSTDGINFTETTYPATSKLGRVKFINKKFYIYQSGSLSLIKSADGINWTKPAQTNLGANTISDLTGYSSGATNYLIALSSGCDCILISTDDAETWTVKSYNNLLRGGGPVAAGTSAIVVLNQTGNSVLTSADSGVTWKQNTFTSPRKAWNINGKFYVYGDSADITSSSAPLSSSSDGNTWATVKTFDHYYDIYHLVVSGTGRLVTPAYYSDDGTNWIKSTSFEKPITYMMYVP